MPGTAVFDKLAPDAKQIGQVTSSAWSLQARDADHPIALAYLRSGFLKSGTTVVVGECDAVVRLLDGGA